MKLASLIFISSCPEKSKRKDRYAPSQANSFRVDRKNADESQARSLFFFGFFWVLNIHGGRCKQLETKSPHHPAAAMMSKLPLYAESSHVNAFSLQRV
jgi:hypothetical protein